MTADNEEKSYGRGQVMQVIQSVMQKIDKNQTKEEISTKIYDDIVQLQKKIDTLKDEIAQTSPNGGSADMHDELDAVVQATEEATNIIMTSCEEIEKASDNLDDDASAAIMAQVTEIYQACGFQDITGQRITKVVRTIKEVDEKITSLMETLSIQIGPITAPTPESDQAANDASPQSEEEVAASLMNGPQMPENAVTQDDIDKLLAEFD